MKTIETSSGKIDIQEIIRALAQLKVPDLEGVTKKLLNILEKKKSPEFIKKEKELVDKIKNCGPKKSVLQRRDELVSKSFHGTMTDVENKEYLEIADIMDEWALERTKLMVELAELRGTTLEDVAKSLNIEPRHLNYA